MLKIVASLNEPYVAFSLYGHVWLTFIYFLNFLKVYLSFFFLFTFYSNFFLFYFFNFVSLSLNHLNIILKNTFFF
jgi:hypothetical protein